MSQRVLIDPFDVPRVGVALLVDDIVEKKVLMMQRHSQGGHGAGLWSLPGGHWEKHESLAECAVRELLEETGLVADPGSCRPLGWTEDYFPDNDRHYATFFFVADKHWVAGQVTNTEPDKTEALDYIRYKDVPKRPLFSCFESLLKGPNIYRDHCLTMLQFIYREHRQATAC